MTTICPELVRYLSRLELATRGGDQIASKMFATNNKFIIMYYSSGLSYSFLPALGSLICLQDNYIEYLNIIKLLVQF